MHHVTQILSIGLEQLKLDRGRANVAGLPQEAFITLLTGLTGQQELKSKEDFVVAQQKLTQLPGDSVQLNAYAFSYDTLRLHAQSVTKSLELPKGVALTPELIKIRDNLIPQQMAFSSCFTGLPGDQFGNQLLLDNLGKELLTADVVSHNKDNTLNGFLGKRIETAINNSHASVSADTLNSLTTRTSSTIGSFFKTTGTQNVAAVAIGFLMAMTQANQPEEVSTEEEGETAERGGSGTFGTLTGGLIVLGQARAQKNAQEEKRRKEEELKKKLDEINKKGVGEPVKPTEETTPPPTPIIVPRATLVTTPPAAPPPTTPTGTPSLPLSFLSRLNPLKKVGGKAVGKALGLAASSVLTGGLAAAAKVITTLLSVLGVDIPLGKITLYAIIIVLLVILIPVFLTIYILTTHNTTPFAVDKISTSLPSSFDISPPPSGETGGSPTPTISTSPSQTPTSENEPHGFPLNSSCVTTLPGQLTHAKNNLNAVDFGNIAQSGDWWAKATHPGWVLYTGEIDNYGAIVILESLDADSNKRFITYYSHLDFGSFKVTMGQIVQRGQELARVDSTGFSTGDHLHYELRGPRNTTPGSDYAPYGTKAGKYGETGTILNFIPGKQTWDCNPPAY